MSERYPYPIPFGWYAIGFGSDLAVGEVKPAKFFGKELVIFRTESGEAKVLDAYCPHLGAHLGHGGKVHGESIACPFHGWQFNGGGQCTAVPYAKNMPPKVAGGKQAIYAYPTVERNQMIWAWYHPLQIAPTYEVEELPEYSDPDWGPVQRFSWTINVSLQETAENAVDAAHFIYVHGSTEMPAGVSKFEGIHRTSEYTMKVPKLTDDGQFDMSGATGEVHLVSVSTGASMGFNRFRGQVEATLLGVPTPIDESTMLLTFSFIQPKNLIPAKKMMADMAVAEICRQVEGDIPIWENKVYLDSPTLCDGDGPIHQYRKWFRQFYADDKGPDLRAVG